MTLPTPEVCTEASAESAPLKFARPDPAARRMRMRDFQTRLVDRMQAARGGSDSRAGQLGVLIGGTRWLFDLQQAGEIVTVGALTTVPLTQPWFMGLTNIRGNLISVVDFARFQGGPATPIDKQCRIIAFAPSLGFNGGLLVSRVLGLRNIAEMQAEVGDSIDNGPAAGASATQAGPQQDRRVRIERFVDREREVWQVLDLAAVTRNPRFLQVGV
jgi:twitching motility protein PilI